MKKRHHVVPQKTFGSLSRKEQIKWDTLACNELVMTNKYLSCEETFGFTLFEHWKKHFSPVIEGSSEVRCGTSSLGHVACHFNNVLLDFSKCITHRGSRSFHGGFFQTFGDKVSPMADSFMRSHQHSPGRLDSSKCDVVESHPVFLASHDDIFNYGHHLNDVINVWAASKLAFYPRERTSTMANSTLLIFDAYRTGGPAGVGRLMDVDDPDALGPFGDIYRAWFGRIVTALDYSSKKICFSELIIPSRQAWVWNDWGAVNECSTKGPSPIWQRFNAENRELLGRLYGLKSQDEWPAPDPSIVNIVLLQRKGLPKRGSGARVLANAEQLVKMLSALGSQVKVSVVDFAGMPFRQQYFTMQSASIFISMHGAGGIHMTNMRVGMPNCCAYLELFPPPSFGYGGNLGHGNIARWSGVRYYTYVVHEGQGDENSGSRVDVQEVERIIRKAMKSIARKPSCLNTISYTW